MKTGLEPVSPVEFVRSELARLPLILYDFKFILNKFHSLHKLPEMEYRDMADHGNMGSLLELLMKKGNGVCQQFVSMLQQDDEVKETFHRLSELDFSRMDSRSPPPGPSAQTGTRGVLRDGPPNQTQGYPKTMAPVGQTLQGHVQHVSEFIKKKVKFFTTVIKTETEDVTVMVFLTSQRKDFMKAQTFKSLVVLESMAIGKNGCLIFNKSSKFRVLLPNKGKGGKGKATRTSTTKEAQSTPSPPCDPNPPPLKVTILGVRLEEKFCCPQGHRLANPFPNHGLYCKPCSMNYNKVHSKRVLSGKVLVRETDLVLELTDVHLRTLLKEAMHRSCDTIGELETALKEVSFLEVTLNQGSVISVSRTRPDCSFFRDTNNE